MEDRALSRLALHGSHRQQRCRSALTFLENLHLFNVNMQFRVNEEASGTALGLGKAFFCIFMEEWMSWMSVSSFCVSYVVMMCMRYEIYGKNELIQIM